MGAVLVCISFVSVKLLLVIGRIYTSITVDSISIIYVLKSLFKFKAIIVVLEKIQSDQRVNFLSLVAMQGANALVPLFVFPYLLATLGAESFAELVIAETLSIIVLAFVLFGFDIVSLNKLSRSENATEESSIFSSVLYTRLCIFFFLIPFSALVYFFYGLSTFELYLLWLLIPLGHILQSSYFFLYKQKNFILAMATLTARVVALCCVFFAVKEPIDVAKVPLILGGTYVIGALAALCFVVFYWNVKLSLPRYNAIYANLKEGFSCFVSNSSVLLYRDLNVVIMSIVFKDPNAISIYALAEKMVKSLQAVFRPISQFYLPKTVAALTIMREPTIDAMRVIWTFTYKQLLLFTMSFLALVSLVYFFEKPIISVISEPVYSALVFSIPMMLVIYFAIPNYMFGMVGLNTLGDDKYLAISMMLVGSCNVLLCLLLSKYIGHYGTAICFVLAEFILFLSILYKYRTEVR